MLNVYVTETDKTLGIIAKHVPDLVIDQEVNGRWVWGFRCVDSSDVDGAENGFNSPIEALAHFIGDQIRLMDEAINTNTNDDEF